MALGPMVGSGAGVGQYRALSPAPTCGRYRTFSGPLIGSGRSCDTKAQPEGYRGTGTSLPRDTRVRPRFSLASSLQEVRNEEGCACVCCFVHYFSY